MKITLELVDPQEAVKVLQIAADDQEIGVAAGQPFIGRRVYRSIAAQIEAQLPKPRIPEPGSLAVIEAGDPHREGTRRRYVRVGRNWLAETQEYSETARCACTWDELIDPTLIREGV